MKFIPIDALYLASARTHGPTVPLLAAQMLFICILQILLMPYIFHRSFTDLFTPWYITICVFQPRVISLGLGILASYILETHSTMPALFFIANYLVLGLLIAQIKSNISWRSYTPWMSSFITSSIWLSLSESFIVILKIGVSQSSLVEEATMILIRLLLCSGFGYLLVYKHVNVCLEESSD